MIVEYLMHATVYLAFDLVVRGPLAHQTIEFPVCALRTPVFGSAHSPPSFACFLIQ